MFHRGVLLRVVPRFELTPSKGGSCWRSDVNLRKRFVAQRHYLQDARAARPDLPAIPFICWKMRDNSGRLV